MLAPGRWRLDDLTGRLIELAGEGAVASLSAAAGLVLEAQQRAEPVVWLSRPTAMFFPPDLAEVGIDLAALVVVRAPEVLSLLRAAERLLRSGSFGLVVIDLERLARPAEISMATIGKLAGLAQLHEAAVVLLTEKSREEGSLGAMVSLRAEARRERSADDFQIVVRAVKDKRGSPGWKDRMGVGAPPGMR